MSPTAFQIVSDLHLETHPSYTSFHLAQTAPNLALLGDIGHVTDDALFTFLQRQLTRYWNVLYLPGNHEPLGTSWAIAKARLENFARRMEDLRQTSTIGRFVLLDQTRFDISEGLTVLGCTLFSRVVKEELDEVRGRLIEFRAGQAGIQGWTVEGHVAAHEADLGWLNGEVARISREEPAREIVVFTHYSPTVDERAVDERHRGSSVSSGFATDLRGEECWRNEKVVLWGFGHTHHSCDFVDEESGKRVVANQKGYHSAVGPGTGGGSGKGAKGFDVKKVILVGK